MLSSKITYWWNHWQNAVQIKPKVLKVSQTERLVVGLPNSKDDIRLNIKRIMSFQGCRLGVVCARAHLSNTLLICFGHAQMSSVGWLWLFLAVIPRISCNNRCTTLIDSNRVEISTNRYKKRRKIEWRHWKTKFII